MANKKTNQIIIQVGLDEDNVPERIDWRADAADDKQLNEAKAMLLAFFDRDSRDTLKIDLWTKEMQVMEMDRFFFQTLRAMADTYFKATQNNEMAADMQRFVHYFGQKTGVIGK